MLGKFNSSLRQYMELLSCERAKDESKQKNVKHLFQGLAQPALAILLSKTDALALSEPSLTLKPFYIF